MKANKIFVGVNGATLNCFQSVVGVAVYPVQKGGDKSYVLLDTGRVASLKGARINGLGVPRFLKENNFELAGPGNEAAAKLADYLDVQEGIKVVEDAMSNIAGILQKKFGGMTCTFVPFDVNKPVRQVEIEADCISTCIRLDMVEAFSAALVKTVYKAGSGSSDVSLSDGWLVGPEGDASNLPRMTNADELIERAVYCICNSGLGSLAGTRNLVENADMPTDGLFYKGPLEVALTNGDRLLVGGTAVDELAVQYIRNGSVLYQRVDSISAPKLGPVIGDIAAVLVRVAEMDAEPTKKPLKKAA